MPAMRCGVLAPNNSVGLCLSLLACAANAAGGGLNADHKNSFGAQDPPIGDGRNKSLTCFAVREGSSAFPRAGKASPVRAVVRADSVDFTAFFLASPCSPSAAAHPKTWQPPKASRRYRFTEYLPFSETASNIIDIGCALLHNLITALSL